MNYPSVKQTNQAFGQGLEEDHSSVYSITPPLQSSADGKAEKAGKAGQQDTGVEEGLQAQKEK